MALLVLLALLCERGLLGEPFESAVGMLTTCPHRARTGRPCPLCGTTTAAILLLEGRPGASLSVNPLGVGLSVAGGLQVLYRGFRVLRPALRLREELAVGAVSVAAVAAALTLT